MTFIGVDLSDLGAEPLIEEHGGSTHTKVINCKLPTTFNKFDIAPVEGATIEVIGCSDTTSQAATSSIQDYYYEDIHGVIVDEQTTIRTGGSTDNATGAFSYAMTPRADSTLEGTGAALKSPWISAWVMAGSQTLTVFFCNDGGVDYYDDEVSVEWLVPDDGDTAQHDYTNTMSILESTTLAPDDPDSTWGGVGANAQKFTLGVTSGFEGEVRARLVVSKRQAVPDTVYLDPRIGVS